MPSHSFPVPTPSHLLSRARPCLGACTLLALMMPEVAAAQTLPNGFQESIVFTGLVEPTVVRFAR